jgi:hypothetical protein
MPEAGAMGARRGLEGTAAVAIGGMSIRFGSESGGIAGPLRSTSPPVADLFDI